MMTSPYWLLPGLLLLSFQWPLTGVLYFHAALACVPLAAFAGDRHGWRGVGMVVVGGSLLPFGLYLPVGGFPAEPGLYLVAIALAAMLASGWRVPDLADRFRPGFGFLAALLLLPLHLVVAREGLDNGVDIGVSIRLLPALFFLLFLLGSARAPTLPVLSPLALATAAGLALALLDGTLLELPRRIGYRLDTPADFLTGAACFLAGRYQRELHEAQGPITPLPARPLGTCALLLVLWGGYPAWHFLVIQAGEHGDLLRQLAPVGSRLALPLAALLAGWCYRRRGVAGVICMAAIVETSGVLLAWSSANLGAPVVAFAFGALGSGLRDRREGTHTPWHPVRWVRLALVSTVSLTLILGLEPGEARDLLLLALSVAAIFALPIVLRTLLRRAGLWLSDAARQGWLATMELTLLLLGLLSHLQEALGVVVGIVTVVRSALPGFQISPGWEAEVAPLLGIGALLYVALLLTALSAALDRLLAVTASARTLIDWLRGRLSPGSIMARQEREETVENADAYGWLHSLTRGIRWVRNALLLAAVGATLLLMLDEFC